MKISWRVSSENMNKAWTSCMKICTVYKMVNVRSGRVESCLPKRYKSGYLWVLPVVSVTRWEEVCRPRRSALGCDNVRLILKGYTRPTRVMTSQKLAVAFRRGVMNQHVSPRWRSAQQATYWCWLGPRDAKAGLPQKRNMVTTNSPWLNQQAQSCY